MCNRGIFHCRSRWRRCRPRPATAIGLVGIGGFLLVEPLLASAGLETRESLLPIRLGLFCGMAILVGLVVACAFIDRWRNGVQAPLWKPAVIAGVLSFACLVEFHVYTTLREEITTSRAIGRYLREMRAGQLDGLRCPWCQADAVTVRFTHPRDDLYFVWFLCSHCGKRCSSPCWRADWRQARFDAALDAVDRKRYGSGP